MAATKVMKFWAVCLAMLGKLLASLGVSAAASAARRDAALYERTLGNGKAGTDAPGTEAPEAVHCAVPDPGPGTPAVPAPRAVPLFGQPDPARRMFARPELPPTIKQRISAEAHGTSPGLRSRTRTRTEPLVADELTDSAGAAPDRGAEADARTAAVPAARRHASTARVL
ncbi:DUF6344 domain-containing protein [Streptomyces decoyicus]|uniref:DUF6344 domain-containing protein n=1 Tax=Streptomyces decoyicus TaxID=249567 RepID=UPI0004AA92B6|nr:DUF6344 domain-containing protein [Streptomyces decoyicus]KOG41526.1 hypothetical protein ADK74_19965 [Streptomyces decoyicus]QZY16967.1 DUF6344 domain-containing protein [Streptomyces decoyicus]